MEANAHVALIDSGIGGFSILDSLEQMDQGVTISYFMDNLYLPYGELSEFVLLQRLTAIVEFLSQNAVDLVVIACNTATTQALEFLRQRFQLPFVGVVPAIKPAAQLTRSGIIGLLATPATVNSHYTAKLVSDFAPHCTVKTLGSSALVHFAEQQFWNDDEPELGFVEELESLFDVDMLVLGCTHFPMVNQYIQRWMPASVTLIDSGMAVAKQVAKVIETQALKNQQPPHLTKSLYTTSALTQAQLLKLNKYGFDRIEMTRV